MIHRILIATVVWLAASEAAFAQPPENSQKALRNKSLVCNGVRVAFAKDDSVTFKVKGDTKAYKRSDKFVTFGRNHITIHYGQESVPFKYRFGKYYYEHGDDTPCEVR